MTNNNPALKIAAIMLGIGLMSGGYFFFATGEEDFTPPAPAPLSCKTSSDCELRGKDEWESCDHKSAPRSAEQGGGAARDQTSKTQEGFVCVCLPSSVCGWAK